MNFGSNLGCRKNILGVSRALNNKPIKLFTHPIQMCKSSECIIIPRSMTPMLAEETGIHVGDGHLSANRNRYKLYGNIDESEYYRNFIRPLYKKLYGLDINIRKRTEDNTIGFEKNSLGLWLFKTSALSLPCGKKGEIGVPSAVMNSGHDARKAFIRGLFDTDGNINMQSRYGHERYYPRLSIGSKSQKLCNDVNIMLSDLGFKPKIYYGGGYFSIVMYGYDNVLKYAAEIGWHNKKHEKKFIEWRNRYPKIANGRSGVVSGRQCLPATRSA